MRLMWAVPVLLMSLTGCNEEEVKSSPQSSQPPQKLSADLHQFKLPPKVASVQTSPQELEVDLEEVRLPSARPLVREQLARRLRGERLYRTHQTPSSLSKDTQWIHEVHFQDKDYASQGLSQDVSTYPVDRSRMITAEMRISAVLEDSINSQIPGRAIAVIDRDTLSADGKNILLPAYSKIICHYESLTKQGQTRLGLKCHRILCPDGVSLLLTDAQSADQMGRTGLVGEMDYRLWQRYGGAFLISGISALSQAGSGMTRSRAVDQGMTNLSQNLAQITAQFLEEAVDIKPVITIAAGSRIQIIPETDMVLKKPVTIKRKKRNSK